MSRRRALLDRPSALVDGYLDVMGVAASRRGPLRSFDVDEITDVMRAAGLVDVRRRIRVASQIVSGRRPDPQASPQTSASRAAPATVDPLAGKNSTPNTV